MRVLTLKCKKCGKQADHNLLCPECLQESYKSLGHRFLMANAFCLLVVVMISLAHYL